MGEYVGKHRPDEGADLREKILAAGLKVQIERARAAGVSEREIQAIQAKIK
jgi:hypothetical protein